MQRQVYIKVNGQYVVALYAVRNAGWAVAYGSKQEAMTFEVAELGRAMRDVRNVVGTGVKVEVTAK